MNIVSHPITLLNPYAFPFTPIPKLDLSLAIKIQQEELEEEDMSEIEDETSDD